MHSSRMRTVLCSGRPWGWRGNLPGGVCTVGLSACQGGVCIGGGGYLPRGCSSGSSRQVRGVAEKHEIYAAVKGGHLFYDLFLRGWGGGGIKPSVPLDLQLGGLPARVLGVSACWGGVYPEGCLTAGGMSACQGCACLPDPPVDRMTDTCKYITLPQLCCGR